MTISTFKIFKLCIIFSFLFISGLVWGKGKPSVKISPLPDWVKNISIDTNTKVDVLLSNGEYFLLVEKQINALGKQNSIYRHYAIKVTNENAVDNNSRLSFAFAPSYEKLILHTIRVWRNGKSKSQLSTKKIDLMR